MTRDPITVKGNDPVIRSLKFTASHVGRLPVTDINGTLIGIITKGDITRGILKALQKDYQAEEVRRYRASHLFEDIESERTSLILRYNIKAGDFYTAALHPQKSSALTRLGATTNRPALLVSLSMKQR